MKPRFAWSELDRGLETGDWPAWLPYGSFAIATVTTALAFLQRIHAPGLVEATISLAIAFAPFLLDAIAYLTGRRCALPHWLFPVPVLAAMIYLVLHEPSGGDVEPFILVFMTAGVVSRSTEQPLLAIGTVVASCAVVILPDIAGITKGFSVWVMAILFASGGGLLVRMLTQRTLELRQVQEHLAETAVAEERSRIAREVHDVIAHSMSVTMLHITAARMALERNKPDDALDALHEAEQQGRKSMGDIRLTVGLLGPDATAAASPLPTLLDLPTLASDFRNAGMVVDLKMNGAYDALPPTDALSVYRIVQESLTNAAKHAPGALTTVQLVVDDKEIHLTVCNAGSNGSAPASDGSGLGIRGMIERARLLGGNLVTGPAETGWKVELVAPRTER